MTGAVPPAPVRVLVIDDEPLVRDGMAAKLAALNQAFAVRTAGDPHEALAAISTWQPAVVFLDIAMPGMSGLDLLGHLTPEHRRFALIFCTAHAEHAVRAFAEDAVDYLLKPVEPERLAAALRKALSGRTPWADRLPPRYLQRLAVRTRKGTAVVDVAAVVELASEAHETVLYTAKTEYVSELSLAFLEDRLDPAVFYRCHRGHIVGLAHVTGIDDDESVILAGPRRVPLARRRRGELLERLKS